MANNKERDERLERYLEGLMSSEERTAFESEIANNHDLQTELDLHKEVEATLADKGELALEATLRQMRPAKPKVRRLAPWVAAAASIALLIAIFVLWNPSTDQNQNPVATYLSEEPMDLTVMGNQEATLSAAQTAYNNGDYTLSLRNLQDYLVENPNNESARIFAARAAIASNEYDEALALLEFFSGRSSLNTEQASWLEALALVGLERWSEAGPLLDALKNATTPAIQDKAIELAAAFKEELQ